MQFAKCALAICSIPASALAQCDAEECDSRKRDAANSGVHQVRSNDGGGSRALVAGAGSSATVPATIGASAQRPHPDVLLRTARDIVAMRKQRNRHFRAALFAEPAWDMLLDLFIAHLEGRQVYVTSLCIAANTPSTTALRYIQDLERHGEIIGMADPRDGRRRWLRLSDAALTGMADTLATLTVPTRQS